MALTISRIKESEDVIGGRTRVVMYDFTLDTSYPAGGYSVAAALVGFKVLRGVQFLGGNAASRNYVPFFDRTNNKVGLTSPNGSLYNYVPGGGDIKGSTNTNSENADAASGGTNGALISNSAAVSTLVAGAMLINAQPDVSRNVLIQIENTTGGALNLFEGATSIVVVGTFRGNAQTETITFTSTAGNKSVATAKFRLKYGVEPFDRITSITVTNLPAATLNIAAGIGSKLGLPVPLLTPAEADVLKITRTGADLAVTGLVDATNQTVNLDTLSDGNDAAILYQPSGELTGFNLTAVTVRALLIGE